MRINPFKLISFDSNMWASNKVVSVMTNNNSKDKVQKTAEIMDFILKNVSSGKAKIDKEPGIYIINIEDESKSVTSIVGAIDYNERKVLLANEDTQSEKLIGYKEIFKKYKMQINPVLGFYKNGPSITSLVKNTTEYPAKIQAFVNGIKYTLWCVKNPIDLANIKESLLDITTVYIADGHHRFSIFESIASKVNAKLIISLTDSDSIRLKSCHRVIVGKIAENWMQTLSRDCVFEVSGNFDITKDIIIKFRDGMTYRVLFRSEIIVNNPLYLAIDQLILHKAFGIGKNEEKIYPLPGNLDFSDTQAIFNLYKNSSVIVFIPHLKISEFFKIVDGGNRLPPTSTWFEPKIIDGFIMNAWAN
jgi:uncharacterized protein (DUF1015 family)